VHKLTQFLRDFNIENDGYGYDSRLMIGVRDQRVRHRGKHGRSRTIKRNVNFITRDPDGNPRPRRWRGYVRQKSDDALEWLPVVFDPKRRIWRRDKHARKKIDFHVREF